LIDEGRQWFKAEVGPGVRETPIDSSICVHAILQPDLFIVPDTTLDSRFCDNALVVGDLRIPGLISCHPVQKGRCAVWHMSSVEVVIFIAMVVVGVALLA
jgi:hypothetical protein